MGNREMIATISFKLHMTINKINVRKSCFFIFNIRTNTIRLLITLYYIHLSQQHFSEIKYLLNQSRPVDHEVDDFKRFSIFTADRKDATIVRSKLHNLCAHQNIYKWDTIERLSSGYSAVFIITISVITGLFWTLQLIHNNVNHVFARLYISSFPIHHLYIVSSVQSFWWWIQGLDLAKHSWY